MSSSSASQESFVNRSGVVRIRGLPFSAAEADIEKFFEGLAIDTNGIVLQKNYQGRPTGQAFVKFRDAEASERALERNRQHMGSRYIEVFPASPSDLDAALRLMGRLPPAPASSAPLIPHPPTSAGVPGHPPPGPAGAPFFPYPPSAPPAPPLLPSGTGGFGLPNQGGILAQGGNWPQPGLPGYGFSQGAALPGVPGPVGDRLGVAGFQGVQAGKSDFRVPGNPDMRYRGVIRMRGMPYSATVSEVRAFFQGLEIAPEGVFLCPRPDGRASGEAYVEFVDEETASRSLQFHREPMGHRYVELFRSTKGEMLAAMQQSMVPSWQPYANSPLMGFSVPSLAPASLAGLMMPPAQQLALMSSLPSQQQQQQQQQQHRQGPNTPILSSPGGRGRGPSSPLVGGAPVAGAGGEGGRGGALLAAPIGAGSTAASAAAGGTGMVTAPTVAGAGAAAAAAGGGGGASAAGATLGAVGSPVAAAPAGAGAGAGIAGTAAVRAEAPEFKPLASEIEAAGGAATAAAVGGGAAAATRGAAAGVTAGAAAAAGVGSSPAAAAPAPAAAAAAGSAALKGEGEAGALPQGAAGEGAADAAEIGTRGVSQEGGQGEAGAAVGAEVSSRGLLGAAGKGLAGDAAAPSSPAPSSAAEAAAAAVAALEHVCVRMRGLPFSATQDDILAFFSGYQVVPNGIHIMTSGPAERPTGEALVEFVTPEETSRAMQRHKQHMGTRYIELFRISKSEALLAIQGGTFANVSMFSSLDPNMQLLLLQQQQLQLAAMAGGLPSWQDTAAPQYPSFFTR